MVSLLKKDSLEISDVDREEIKKQVKNSLERRIIITHGTDTMTDTAKYSDIKDKVIVFTGAMEPAGLRYTDAIFNVGCAVTAVQCLPPGVYITMNGQIFNALKVRKKQSFEKIRANRRKRNYFIVKKLLLLLSLYSPLAIAGDTTIYLGQKKQLMG